MNIGRDTEYRMIIPDGDVT